MSTNSNEWIQREICIRFDAVFVPIQPDQKIGIAANIRTNLLPLNGLRHPPVGDTTGWYIWAGKVLSDSPDFFKPLHIQHLDEWCPKIERYLGLAPGWRFLITDDYEDVWFDPTLLNPD